MDTVIAGGTPITIAAATTGAGVTAPHVVVAGGHSAGHIEPTMNFADALRRLEPTAEITALGTVRGLDTTLIPARGYSLELIPAVPLPRKLNRDLLQTPGRLRDSIRAAGAVLDRVRAEVVVGFGGYVAVPAYLAARGRGLPIVVHEANAQPGVANRLAARMTTHVFTAAPSVRLAHATAIGIPLRPACCWSSKTSWSWKTIGASRRSRSSRSAPPPGPRPTPPPRASCAWRSPVWTITSGCVFYNAKPEEAPVSQII